MKATHKLVRKTLAMLLVAAVFALTACGSTSSSTAANNAGTSSTTAAQANGNASGSKTLSVYFAWGDDELPTYIEAFERDTGIKISYVRLSAGEMIARITAEKENPPVSLMIGGGTENYITAAQAGLLEPYESPELVNIPDEYKDPDNYWSPVGVVTLCFAVNTEWFEENNLEYPQTWDDLTNPVYKDMVAMAHPSTSGVSSNILTSIVQMRGEDAAWEYFTALDANIPHYAKASSSTPSSVALGEAAIGLTNQSDVVKYQVQGYPITSVVPAETFLDVNAVALVKNGPEDEVENAKIFIDWLLSVQGQESFIEADSYRMPLNVNAQASEGLTPLSEINVVQIDRDLAGKDRTRLIEEFITRIDDATELA